MQSYLTHLLTDINAAHRPDDDGEPDGFPATIEEEFEQMENWLLTDPVTTFGQYCGLDKEQFPPAEKWTSVQLEKIIIEFNQMMHSWGVDTDLPEDLPLDIQYQFLVRTLDEKITLVPGEGFTVIEFCEDEPMECPFGKAYCSCQKYFDAADRNQRESPQHEQVRKLTWYIRDAFERMPQTLEFQDAVTDLQLGQDDGGVVYKPLAEWLEIDLSKFPPAAELTEWELAKLADGTAFPFRCGRFHCYLHENVA